MNKLLRICNFAQIIIIAAKIKECLNKVTCIHHEETTESQPKDQIQYVVCIFCDCLKVCVFTSSNYDSFEASVMLKNLRQYNVYANYAESVNMLKNVKYLIPINIGINMCEAII